VIRAVIADDEALSRRLVHQMLDRHADVTIVGECADGAAVRDAIALHNPDVVFLDIRMPVKSGLDVARHQPSGRAPLVVFVPAYEKVALPAFETDAVDYLTKPQTDGRYEAALARVRDRLRLRRLADRNAANTSAVTHLVSRVGSRDLIIPVEAIEFIEADDVYAAVVASGKRYLVRVPLDELERTLDGGAFLRVHRSFIVRLDRIVELRRTPTPRLVLVGGAELPVSRRRRAALEAHLKPVAT
jgi:two-component system, LytTR family, response regulator